jgi:hypothetical protein
MDISRLGRSGRADWASGNTTTGRALAFSGGMHDMTENPLAKLVIGGGVTIVFETLLGGHALEFAKVGAGGRGARRV